MKFLTNPIIFFSYYALELQFWAQAGSAEMAEVVGIVTLMRFPVKFWQPGGRSSGYFGTVPKSIFSYLCLSSVWMDELSSFIIREGIAQSNVLCRSIPSVLLGSWSHRAPQRGRTKRCCFACKNSRFNGIPYYRSSYFHKASCKWGEWGQPWFKDGKSKLTSVNDLSKTMAKSKWEHRALDVSSTAKTTRASSSSLCKEKAAASRLLGQSFKGSDCWDF